MKPRPGFLGTQSREKHAAKPVQFGKAIVLLQIFQPVLPPRLLPQELQRYDPLDVKLQPLARDNLARSSTEPFAR